MQEGQTLKADNSLTQSIQRLIENKKLQLVLALILVLLAIRLYFPSASAPPDAQLVNGSTLSSSQTATSLATVQQYQASLEEQLERVLGQIKGAGEVTVMLTLASSSDFSIAANTQQTSRSSEEKDPSGSSKITTEETLSSQPVMSRTTGGDAVVKLKELTPQISGVVVIASGASESKMQVLLTKAVQTILSVPAHRVRVFPGK